MINRQLLAVLAIVVVAGPLGVADRYETACAADLQANCDQRSVTILDGQKPVLRYRFADVVSKPYADQLFSPAGVQVLRDAPKEHAWHHGLMLAVIVDKVNFWEENTPEYGKQQHKELAVTNVPAKDGVARDVIDEVVHWTRPDSDEPLMIERRTISVLKAADLDATLISWHSRLEVPPGKESITITGNHYHGLGMRFIESMDKGGRFFNADDAAGEVVRRLERLTPTKWCALTGNADGKPVTVAIFDHPQNVRFPARMFTMPAAFAYLSATRNEWKEPLVVKADKPLELTYGVALWDGEVDKATVERLYQRWLAETLGGGEEVDRKVAFQCDEGESVLGVAFSDDGKLLFSHSAHLRGIDEGRMRIWDRSTGALVKCRELDWAWGDIWSHEKPIINNQPAIVRSTRSGIHVCDLITGKAKDFALREMDEPATGYVLSDAWSVFVGENMHGVTLAWNLKTGALRLRYPVAEDSTAMPMTLSGSGRYLAIPGVVSNKVLKDGVLVENSEDPYSGFVAVWSLKEPRQVFDLRWPHRVDAAAISADDKIVVFGGYNREFEPGWLNAVNIATGEPLPGFPQKTKFLPAAFAFSPDGRRLCWGDAGGTLHIAETSAFHEDREIIVPRAEDDEKYDNQFYYTKYVGAVGFSPDGTLIASGGRDGRIRIWNVRSGVELTPNACSGNGLPTCNTPN